VPVAVVEATAMVMLEVPEPGDAMDAGIKPTVTPVGCPVADKATAELNPPEMPTMMVEEPLLPCTTDAEAGDAEMVKSGDAEPTVNVTVVVWFRVPEAPWIVTVNVPSVAVAVLRKYSVLVPVVGFGPNEVETPLGTPVAER
jgi:hypothetical protein